MRTIRTYGVRAVAAGVLAAALLALVTGLVSPLDTASAAQDGGSFESQLGQATESPKIVSTGAAPFGDSVQVAKKAATPIAPKPTAATYRTGGTASSGGSSSGGSVSRARSILAGYVARYPILQGSTVSFGDARGYQAICYYKSGRIVISPSHTVSLERILAHEVWHIIDWRDNGRIDWGENVPPN